MGQMVKFHENAMALIANVPNSEGNSGNFPFGTYIKRKNAAPNGAKGEILPIANTNYVTKNRFD